MSGTDTLISGERSFDCPDHSVPTAGFRHPRWVEDPA